MSDIFNRAFDTKMVQQDVDQIVAVTLSRAGYERRRLESGNHRKTHFDFVIPVPMEYVQSQMDSRRLLVFSKVEYSLFIQVSHHEFGITFHV